jgi:hypothetical protein
MYCLDANAWRQAILETFTPGKHRQAQNGLICQSRTIREPLVKGHGTG